MRHLESSFQGRNGFWFYVLMVVIVFIAIQLIGGIPVYVYLFKLVAADPESINNIAGGNYDFGPYGLEINLFPFIIGLLTILLFMKPIHQRSYKTVINGGRKFRWDHFLKSYLVWLAISAFYLFISLELYPDNFRVNNLSITLVRLVAVSLLIIPFQAAFEEVLLRGYFMQGFGLLTRNRWAPLLITSVIFALMHGLNPEVEAYGFLTAMPQYLLFGLVFGIMTLLNDGVEASTGAHAANNAFLCIMVTNKDAALQTPAVFEQTTVYPWTEFGFMIIMSALALYIMSKLFKWDWALLKSKVGAQSNGLETGTFVYDKFD
jgi:membrane protease YdiL (CAAX protease family)